MTPYKIGYIKLKYNNKTSNHSVYMNNYTIYFELSIEEKTKKELKTKKESKTKKVKKRFNIFWSTDKKGFPKDYIKMMKTQAFPKSHVEKENPIVAEGKIKGKEELVLDKINFPY